MSDTPHVIRGGPVRARDLRVAIREMGFERGVTHTLERLLDEFAAMRSTQRSHVELTDQLVNNVTTFLHIGVTMRDQIDALKRSRDSTDEVNHDAQ